MFPPSGMTPVDYGAVIGIAATSLSDEELLRQLAMHQAAVAALLKVGRERAPKPAPVDSSKWTYQVNLSEHELEAMAQVTEQFRLAGDVRRIQSAAIPFYVAPVVK